MDYHNMHTHISVLLTSIVTVSLLLLTTLPPSFQQSPINYSHCSHMPYNCGGLQNISYPFWGQDRRDYCGAYQFNLNCVSDNYTYIQMGCQKFVVEEINTTAYTMKMVPMQPIVCSLQFDFSLSPLFRYQNTVHNYTIFHGCPSGVSFHGNNSTCTGYEGGEDEVLKRHPELKKCNRSIQVPTESPVESNSSGVLVEALNRAFGKGFHVSYMVSQKCIRCLGSEGACGSNDTVEHQSSCYSPDGTNTLNCPVSIPDTVLVPAPALAPILVPAPAPVPVPVPVPVPHHKSNQSTKKTDAGNHWTWQKKVIIGVTIAVVGGLLTICCFICKLSRWQEKSWLPAKSNQNIEAFLKNQGALTLKRYKFSDVKKMTNSFKVKLGQGGFGAVYKGELLNGSNVAVKILNPSKGNGEEFINEVASISRTSHVNVVTLLGFCIEGRKKVLIYEFMSNGSLDKFIYKKGHESTPSLSWDNLYQIAIGIAKGLEYLHRGCNTRILHFDIKPHNILLDENFCPKISDFGLAKLCPRKESIISMSDARGTIGYVAPEVWNRHFGGVSHKSDVYSYGMMLLEIVGGRKNINSEASQASEIYFPNWIYSRLEQGTQLGLDDGEAPITENEVVKKMTVVGLWCIQTIPNDRPTMSRVIDMLEGSMNSLEMPPRPVLSSPVRSVVESSTTVN